MLLYVSIYNTWKISWQMKVIKSSCVNAEQRSSTARCHWNSECQIRGPGVRFSQRYLWKTTPFPLVNRNWHLKGACCCHVKCLWSPRRSRSWKQQDHQISVTVYQPTQNCINNEQLEKGIHGQWYIFLKGWLRPFCPIMSCCYYNFTCKSKNFFIIFLKNASTGL